MDKPFYGRYRARCTRVVDGDTADLVVDLGFRLTSTMRVRFWGIDTPELTSKDPELRKKAVEAKEFVIARLMGDLDGWPLMIETLKDPDNFGRWLAKIWYTREDDSSPVAVETLINDELVFVGLAEEYRR